MSMQDINETHEVTDAELDAVSGGWFSVSGFNSVAFLRLVVSTMQEQDSQPGQDSPSQMFAQIMG